MLIHDEPLIHLPDIRQVKPDIRPDNNTKKRSDIQCNPIPDVLVFVSVLLVVVLYLLLLIHPGGGGLLLKGQQKQDKKEPLGLLKILTKC